MMNVLILGSGGREHAFAYKIKESPLCTNLFVAPGNSGTLNLATNLEIQIDDFSLIESAIIANEISLVIVGPEVPLVNGIHDFLINNSLLKDIIIIGPKKEAAQLEGSKDYAKEFLNKHNIPTGKHETFTANNIDDGYNYIDNMSPPYVLKADGLAAGKGVLIIESAVDAKEQLYEMLINSKFGRASSSVVVEEFLDGIELSCFVVTDGKRYKLLPSAKDYKRIGEGDTGLNTGGMGAVSPPPFLSEKLLNKIENKIIKRTIDGLKKDNLDYQGFIFFGLIIVENEPYIIEYNVRMGDPESEVVLPRIKSDFLQLLISLKNGSLDKYNLIIDDLATATVFLVSGGYPEDYQKSKQIYGLDSVTESIVFHAGAVKKDDKTITSGGRVLAVTSSAETVDKALKKSYSSIEKISFENMNYRKDIGFDL